MSPFNLCLLQIN